LKAYRLPDVTVVADACMVSEAKQKAIEDPDRSFIVGMKMTRRPLPGSSG
jgi:hypothetical protein